MKTLAPTFRIAEIDITESPVVLRMPFRFGIVTLRRCFEAHVRVRIESADGRSAWGATSEMLVPKWFDKNPALSDVQNFDQLRDVLRLARDAYLSDAKPDSAFGHFARHHDQHLRVCAGLGHNPLLANYGPAQIDKAVLDAFCRWSQQSFYSAVQTNSVGIGDRHPAFDAFPWPAFLSDLRPQTHIHARHTVGLLDALSDKDVTEPVGDGLPETLEQVVRVYGHRYFKLKVSGQLKADIERLSAIASVLDTLPQAYHVTLDGNEQYTDAAAFADLLTAMRATPALRRLLSSILFIEQPIARAHALDTDVSGAAIGLPVIVDESDGTLDAFEQARARGYSGISSKTCKGIYRSLLNAARCQTWNAQLAQPRYFMSAEDLTVQAGLCLQQDLALVNLLGIGHVERNGHHYVNGLAARPADEQARFLKAHPDLYENSHGAARVKIQGGRLSIASLAGVGFASSGGQ
jgi:L-alanine-DL-glutamate epimerase-like enolase superfamily enzyme